MAFTEMKIEKSDLQITKTAYFRLFGEFREAGDSMHKAFLKIENICKDRGCKNYYSTFTSFKTAYYNLKKK